MRITITTALFILLFSLTLFAEPFFISQKEAWKRPEFQAFKSYCQKNPSDNTAMDTLNSVFRLNNKEFLFSNCHNLLYYSVDADSLAFVEGISWHQIKREFLGKNNKRFVLISGGGCHHGNCGNGYSILNLVPKTADGSFVLYSLISASQDGESGFCGAYESTDEKGRPIMIKKFETGTTESITNYSILNEGTDSVKIVFNVTEQNCSSLKYRKYTKTFTSVNQVFKEVPSK